MFGRLKFFPGLSPAQDLAARTIAALSFGLVPGAVSVPLLAALESAIGLGLVAGRWLRATLLLLFAQMAGTVTPLLLFPHETFTLFPVAPTLEGQYIIKNIVLVSAAILIGATVRGGLLIANPVAAREARAKEGGLRRRGPGDARGRATPVRVGVSSFPCGGLSNSCRPDRRPGRTRWRGRARGR